MALDHALQSALCPFDHALCLGFTALAVVPEFENDRYTILEVSIGKKSE
jgi:hypothetical protein